LMLVKVIRCLILFFRYSLYHKTIAEQLFAEGIIFI
jgi:hypothetical protein